GWRGGGVRLRSGAVTAGKVPGKDLVLVGEGGEESEHAGVLAEDLRGRRLVDSDRLWPVEHRFHLSGIDRMPEPSLSLDAKKVGWGNEEDPQPGAAGPVGGEGRGPGPPRSVRLRGSRCDGCPAGSAEKPHGV